MSYAAALEKAWLELSELAVDTESCVKFLSDEYTLDFKKKKVISLSSDTPAKDHIAILLLHYLTQKIKGLPDLTSEWLSFKELSGIEGYGSVFKKRVIDIVANKYGQHPQELLSVLERFSGKRVDQADVGIVLEVFERVPLLVLLWRGDEEFSPSANILFDKCITNIFCIEDIIVMAETVVRML